LSQNINIHVEKEFGIPQQQLGRSIAPDLLHACGIAPPEPKSRTVLERARGAILRRPEEQPSLLLSAVVVEGNSYGGGSSWAVVARSGQPEDFERFTRGDEDTLFGVVDIGSTDHRTRIEPPEVLELTEGWIRSSPSVEWMPGKIIPLEVPADMAQFAVLGVTLVRATERPAIDS